MESNKPAFERFTVITAGPSDLRYYEVESHSAHGAIIVAKVNDWNSYPQCPSDFKNCVVQRGQNHAVLHVIHGD